MESKDESFNQKIYIYLGEELRLEEKNHTGKGISQKKNVLVFHLL